MRQVDIRSEPNGKGVIQFKTFTAWNHDLDKWHIFVELANEQWVEKDVIRPELN